MIEFDRQRFWSYVKMSSDGCWEWTGYKDPEGYGRFKIKVDDVWRSVPPYRVMWWLMFGVMPDNEIDHLCVNPGCVNPAHLDDVIHEVNVYRARLFRCRNGHSPDAWYSEPSGRRRCITCVDETNIRHGKRKDPPRLVA